MELAWTNKHVKYFRVRGAPMWIGTWHRDEAVQFELGMGMEMGMWMWMCMWLPGTGPLPSCAIHFMLSKNIHICHEAKYPNKLHLKRILYPEL